MRLIPPEAVTNEVRGKTVVSYFSRHRRLTSRQVALRWRDGDTWPELTWGDYADRACRVGVGLAALGVGQTVKHANDTLSKVEQVKRFRVLAGPRLPDSDVLTALSKLKRRNIAARYSDEIDQMSADTPRKPVQVVAAG
jgi:long-subunit acyl-CoA synthetase (AMP-forming)